MELRHLRYFLAVVEESGFSRAARRLRVAQPTLSRQIQDLEEEIGFRLLDRDTHGVAATGAGRRFAARASEILDAVRQAVAEAGRVARGESGMLSIGFVGSLGHELLPRIFRQCRVEMPDVALDLHEMSPGEQIERLQTGRLDLGFIGMAEPDPTKELMIETLLEENLVVALPEGHPLAIRDRLGFSDIRDERFVLTARRNTPVYNHWLTGLCRESGFEPTVAMEVDRAPTALNYIAAGYGVSVFPEQIARQPAPGVVFIRTTPGTPRYRYCLARKGGAGGEVVARFCKLARRVAESKGDEGRDSAEKNEEPPGKRSKNK